MRKSKEFILNNFTRSFLTLFLPFFIIVSLIYIIKLSNLSAKASIDFVDFLQLFIYVLPKILFSTIPLTFIGAVINTFSKLSSENELIAIFSLGIRPTKLLKYLLPIALLFTIFLVILTIFIIPIADQKMTNFENKKIYEAKLKIMPQKLSQNFGNHHIFIEENVNNKFKNVTMFTKEKDGFLQILLAKEGNIVKEKDKNSYLNLNNGKLYRYKEKVFNIMEFENMKIYNNQKFYSKKILSTFKYWKEHKKNFYYYLLISLSPLLFLGSLIALGVFNPRYEKNFTPLYILIAALIIYIPAIVTKSNNSLYFFIASIIFWVILSIILFKYKLIKRY